jgi:hypothetical protein
MKITFLFTLATLWAFAMKAENKLVLCSGYDSTGSVTETYPTWKITKTGSYMYVLLQADKPVPDTAYITIEKTFSRRDTAYYLYDHYFLVPSANGNYAVNKYIFSKPGNYRIAAYERNTERLLATLHTVIEFRDDEYYNNFYTDTWYYNQIKFFIGDSISNGKLAGQSDVFAYNPGREKLSMYIEQFDRHAFKTDHLYLRVYLQDKLVRTSSYMIDRNWYWTYLPLYISERGKYALELYSEDDVFIAGAKVEIR